MLASTNRLTRKDDFEKIKREGKMHQHPDFGVIVHERDNEKPSKFAFVISTKVEKAAVQRNRVKRAMSEAVRQYITSIRAGMDVIFLAKKSLLTKTTEQIMSEVKGFIKDKLI